MFKNSKRILNWNNSRTKFGEAPGYRSEILSSNFLQKKHTVANFSKKLWIDHDHLTAVLKTYSSKLSRTDSGSAAFLLLARFLTKSALVKRLGLSTNDRPIFDWRSNTVFPARSHQITRLVEFFEIRVSHSELVTIKAGKLYY